MLARVLSLVGAAAPPANGFVAEDTASEARERLREAQRQLALKEEALTASQEATGRARNAVREAVSADEVLLIAEAAAEDASTAWAAAGAVGSVSEDAQRLLELADKARSRAYTARLIANGAERALSQSQFDGPARGSILANEREAIVARDQAKAAVGAAVREVMEAEVANPALARAEALRSELDDELARVLPLWQVLRLSSNRHAFAGDAHQLQAQLAALTTHPEIARQLPEDPAIRRDHAQLDTEAALAAWGERLLTDAAAGL